MTCIRTLTPVVCLAVSLIACAPAPDTAPAAASEQAASSPAVKPIPDWVRENWTSQVGVWIADNAAYMNANETDDAYGLEWSWGLGRQSVLGRLYGLKDGKETGTYWQFREFWHPGEGQLIVTQFSGTGTYGVGPNLRKDDGSMEMLQVFYDPMAGTAARVGHRSEMKDGDHITRSFDVTEAGVWTDRRTYVWRKKGVRS